MTIVYTVGHGTRTFADFAEVLASAGVKRLVDVRRWPASRRHPHFGRDALARQLRSRGVEYLWRGQDLGGRRRPSAESRHRALRNKSFQGYADHMETTAFRSALEELEAEAKDGSPVALMCAETLWWRCHRRFISDALVVEGLEVRHLLSATKAEPHRLHPALRVDEEDRVVYDRGASLELPPR